MTRPAHRFGWMTLVLALGALALAPGGASAASCDFDLTGSNDGTDPGGLFGGGGTLWETTDSTGQFDDAMLLPKRAGQLTRYDAFDDYGQPEVNDTGYENPDPGDEGCTRSDKGRTLRFPADEVIANVRVTPELYVHSKRPLGRQYVTIRNAGAGPVTIDFGWDGDLGSDDLTNVDRTSSGDGTAAASDRWATSCEDTGPSGCKRQNKFRDPELAHNWERKGQKPQSADAVDLADDAGDFNVTFEDVTIGAGQTIALMQIVTLGRNINQARDAAGAVDAGPGFIFEGLSNKQENRLRNW